MIPRSLSSPLPAFAAAAALALLALTACGQQRSVVIYEAPPPRPYQPPPPPPPTVVYQPAPVVYQEPPPPVREDVVWEDDEVNYVVYREYYGCSPDEVAMIPHYRRYYAVDDADLFFVCFVARHAHVGFDVAFHEYYYGCGRDYNRLVVTYRVDPAVFFVPLPPGAVYPAVYSRPYACYRTHQYASVAFTNDEYRGLVSLKIGVEYQGQSSEVFFHHAQTCGSPTRVVYIERDRCGQGGHACAGVQLQATVHPWHMSASERTTWRAQVTTQRTSSEVVFRQQHHDQVAVAERSGAVPAHTTDHRSAPTSGPSPTPAQAPTPRTGGPGQHTATNDGQHPAPNGGQDPNQRDGQVHQRQPAQGDNGHDRSGDRGDRGDHGDRSGDHGDRGGDHGDRGGDRGGDRR